jgi:hypothetical protein
MKNKFILLILLFISGLSYSQVDTSYISIAPQNIQNMIKPAKAPKFTIQLNTLLNIGLMDLAANDNTIFRKDDFANGRNFGTRYGYGVELLGKLSLHKEGNVRFYFGGSYNRFQSNFIIPKSPEGEVSYNLYGTTLGIENSFTPDRKCKPFVGFEIIGSFISGKATLITDSTDLNLKIKSAFRVGVGLTFGFEYAFTNYFGLNLGVKIANINLFLKKSENSAIPSEINLNDNKIEPKIPYAGWKQFFYYSLSCGFSYYIGLKNKK